MKALPERIFVFRLARELGMTVSRLLDEVDSRELSEWMAFFSIEKDEQEAKKKPDPKQIGSHLMASLGTFNYGSTKKGRGGTR